MRSHRYQLKPGQFGSEQFRSQEPEFITLLTPDLLAADSYPGNLFREERIRDRTPTDHWSQAWHSRNPETITWLNIGRNQTACVPPRGKPPFAPSQFRLQFSNANKWSVKAKSVGGVLLRRCCWLRCTEPTRTLIFKIDAALSAKGLA
jgi:hypothetical protein